MHTERVVASAAPGRSERGSSTARRPTLDAAVVTDARTIAGPVVASSAGPASSAVIANSAERAAASPIPAASVATPQASLGAFLARHLKVLTIGADVLAAALGLMIAIRVYTEYFGGLERADDAALLSLPIWPILFAQQGLYQARHLTRRIEEYRRLVNGVVLGIVALAGISVLLQINLSRGWILLAGGFVLVFSVIEREIIRAMATQLRRSGRMARKIVLVGDNSEADELSEMLQHSRELGYEVVGRVSNQPHGSHDGSEHPDLPHLGSTDDVLEIVRRNGASGVVVATTDIDLDNANRLVRDLTREGIYVELSSAMKDIATRRVTLRPLGRYPVMCVEPVSQNGGRAVFKRAFDIVCALLGLLVTAPVLAVAALAIRITSGPGVLFAQTRVGKDGKPFTVYKLRTMVPDAESLLPTLMDQNEASGPMFKMTNDPRVTPVGNFLRSTSIDELPQLLNVLKGDMSLVGPRPALPHEAVQWNDDLKERLRVQPGITGNWQVNGRFTTSIEDYQRLDMYYVDNWSIVTDLVILAKTIPAVLRRKGAA